jgi:hypothetical protein
VSAEMCVVYRLGPRDWRLLVLFVPTIGNSLTYFRIESRTFEEVAFISDWPGGDVRYMPKAGGFSAIKTTRPSTPFLIQRKLIFCPVTKMCLLVLSHAYHAKIFTVDELHQEKYFTEIP